MCSSDLRLDLIVEFDALSSTVLHDIVRHELTVIGDVLRGNGYELAVDSNVVALIIENGTDSALGARLLHRSIEQHLLAPLSRCEPGSYRAVLGSGRSVNLVRVYTTELEAARET